LPCPKALQPQGIPAIPSGETIWKNLPSCPSNPVTSDQESTGKEWEGMGRNGKEWTGINTLETHCLAPLNIPNKAHHFALLAGIVYQFLSLE
jgi:hypothetical protein